MMSYHFSDKHTVICYKIKKKDCFDPPHIRKFLTPQKTNDAESTQKYLKTKRTIRDVLLFRYFEHSEWERCTLDGRILVIRKKAEGEGVEALQEEEGHAPIRPQVKRKISLRPSALILISFIYIIY